MYSLVLNPRGPQYAKLRDHMVANYVDFYFDEDALFMERNSRDFRRRIIDINNRADQVCELLRSRSVAGGNVDGAIRDVYYPKWQTREHYDKCIVKGSDGAGFDGGFGGLFSLTFTSKHAAQAFFDALPCHKGPSLGTNFTLACPYTILAHFAELPWAAKYGVEESLVRVSVGLEDQATLLRGFEVALKAAEAAHASH
jgi:cystathionine gamma-synthase